MDERYGWSLGTLFGQFVTVATALLAVALIGVSACDYLIDRYQWKLARGEIARPAQFAQVAPPPAAHVLAAFAPPPKAVAREPAVLRPGVPVDSTRRPATIPAAPVWWISLRRAT
jgi:hypothetical protein